MNDKILNIQHVHQSTITFNTFLQFANASGYFTEIHI